MMTKKDYEKAAAIASYYRPEVPEFLAVRNAFIELFRGDNPRFDVERFRKACEGKEK